MYIRTACSVRALFLDGTWSSWHLQIACLHLTVWTVCSVPFFLLVSERSGRDRPQREALVHIELLTNISLSERTRLVHPWPLRAPTWKHPPFITCRTFPAVLRFLRSLGVFSYYSFFLLSFRFCVGVLRVRHRGRARHRRGCQLVLAGRGGGCKERGRRFRG